MKQMNEINRVNYACNKHHVKQLRNRLNPLLQEQIDSCQNPSGKYKDILKTVYHDELEKTVEEEWNKKIQNNHSFSDPRALNYSTVKPKEPFQSISNQNPNARNSSFHDFQSQKNQKYSKLIQNGCNNVLLFKSNDEYLKKKGEQAHQTKMMLLDQLKERQHKKNMDSSFHQKENEIIKQNNIRRSTDDYNNHVLVKRGKMAFGQQIKHQIQEKNMGKGKKTYFQYHHAIRHNPITNPIEYHIDNPYILNKYQAKIYRNN